MTLARYRSREIAAACLVRGQRGFPLPRPGLRGSSVSGCRGVRRRLDAHRIRGADLRAVHPSGAAPSRPRAAQTRTLLVALGLTLAAMNVSFYLALERLPMSLVAAMEFVSAHSSSRSRAAQRAQPCSHWRLRLRVCLSSSGFLVVVISPASAFAVLNAALFGVYIVLGHRAAEGGCGARRRDARRRHGSRFHRSPFRWGFRRFSPRCPRRLLILAGIGVGLYLFIWLSPTFRINSRCRGCRARHSR